MSRRHEEGQTVMAKWPGSHLWFHAKVLKTLEGDKYVVRFEEGTEEEVAAHHVLVSTVNHNLQADPAIA